MTLRHRLWQLALDAARPLSADELAQLSGLPRGNVLILIGACSRGAWHRTREGLYVANPRHAPGSKEQAN